ncbi:DUF4194 domain-containing protein [Xanthomonas nasturtii]|uniref:DUF4194 domain-containing protein n=1 Tax=Xanthomonas nasturtii TaxID=1843581 RepID=A0A3E1KEJ3_9XANT|nr:DUF4194 domain-containing protein [Xanthomonas nasturtii]MCL1501225.1 DUF4194 domain-containing protein [Xanthomonas nasturtii]MCL1505056.1 DUF4194 domain-containing protein [Xanthomonas nasturtii]MCL1524473.1 DUF4194 domain-containing protein [Xanthomonas nasturtii]MCL1528265.1 DUF4194 domain-containing protein [Xanthomonas nasturtii]MCL1532221.1 DUF4194 domain-containing protein [Xanthomonas nasturtii]
MNWPEHDHDHGHDPDEIDADATATALADPSPTPANGLFPGDTGQLSIEARRALCQLLSGPSVDAQRHGRLWPALLRSEAVIRSALAELFLELVLDREAGIAFTRQADTGELDAPVLLRSSPLTFIDSVLLLHLRQQLADADARGVRAVVEDAELSDALAVYEKNLSTDRAGFLRRVATAVQKMKDNHVLTRLRGDEARYEVSPALKLLFSAEDVAALGQVYRQLREGPADTDTDAPTART